MTNFDDDPLLDGCLAELFGGERPPDVTAQVLRRLALGDVPVYVVAALEVPPRLPDELLAPPVNAAAEQTAPLSNGFHRRQTTFIRRARRANGHRAAWATAGLAVTLVLLLGGIAVWRQQNAGPRPAQPELAERSTQPSHRGTGADGVAVENPNPAKSTAPPSQPNDARPPFAKQSAPPTAPPTAPPPTDPRPDHVADDRSPPRSPADVGPPRSVPSPNAAREAQTIALIGESLRSSWAVAGVKPSPKATDAEWCRRVFLAMIGRIPSLDELNRFLAEPAAKRRAALVDRLLASEDYTAEYAQAWSNFWTAALIGRAGGTEDERGADRAGLQQFLRRALATNTPHDRVVFDLITATGSNQPGAEDYNGAVNFLVSKLDDGGQQATAKTAQVFLGRQVQCLQCHNHPFYDGKAQQYWELNAFFRQTRVEPLAAAAPSRGQRAVRIVDRDFAGRDGSVEQAEIYWETANGLMKVAYPVFLDGTAINRTGDVDRVNRRRELAKFVVRSPWLAEATVNRLWEHLFGRGFTRQVDDLGPHNPPSHPELFARLSQEFAASGHDVKSLLRWIVLSEPYALSSRVSPSNRRDELVSETPPLFSRYYLRQLQPEQVYESVLVASRQRDKTIDLAQRERQKTDWLRQFTIAYHTDECDECTTWTGTIPQTALMMNGGLTDAATRASEAGMLRDVASAPQPTARKVQQLYLAALSRVPSAEELSAARRMLDSRGNSAEALEDLWWALLNSNEFILDR